jgi:O-antigen ligase
MLSVYASAAAILLASLVLGRALLHLLGRTEATWLAGAVGFAALTVAAPLLIRLPGRAATVAVLVGVAVLASLYRLWRTRGTRPRTAPGAPLAVIFVVVAAASLPFAFNERHGPLG